MCSAPLILAVCSAPLETQRSCSCQRPRQGDVPGTWFAQQGLWLAGRPACAWSCSLGDRTLGWQGQRRPEGGAGPRVPGPHRNPVASRCGEAPSGSVCRCRGWVPVSLCVCVCVCELSRLQDTCPHQRGAARAARKSCGACHRRHCDPREHDRSPDVVAEVGFVSLGTAASLVVECVCRQGDAACLHGRWASQCPPKARLFLREAAPHEPHYQVIPGHDVAHVEAGGHHAMYREHMGPNPHLIDLYGAGSSGKQPHINLYGSGGSEAQPHIDRYGAGGLEAQPHIDRYGSGDSGARPHIDR